MKEIIILDDDNLRNLESKEDTKLIIKARYIDATQISHLNYFAEKLENMRFKIEIEVINESVMDILELIGITTLYRTTLINK